ncbi:hypothetical protein O988_08164 [Pseudogymnoascus sp. VKM F-3808]|nr:hypothetical protein O988_08164 [Pseudogymnoascus sp. VKM F-3808]
MEHIVGHIFKGQKGSYEILAFLKGQSVAKAKTLPLGSRLRPGPQLVVTEFLLYQRAPLSADYYRENINPNNILLSNLDHLLPVVKVSDLDQEAAFDMEVGMKRYDEWELAIGLEAMEFKDPKTGEMRPYIVGGTLEEELEKLPRELCSRECIEFILYLLELDYKKRPTALEALQHPFIKSTITRQQQNLN